VCGTKNFSSVRLYSAPQLLASDNCHHSGNMRLQRAGSSRIIRCYKKVTAIRTRALNIGRSAAAGSMWDAYCSTTRVKSAIVFSLMVDGSGSRGCHINRGAEWQANRHTVGLGTRDCPLRVGDIDGLSNAQGRSRLTVGAPGRGALGPAGSRMRALSIGSLPSGCLGENREDTVGNVMATVDELKPFALSAVAASGVAPMDFRVTANLRLSARRLRRPLRGRRVAIA